MNAIRAASISVLTAILLSAGCSSVSAGGCVDETQVARLLDEWGTVQLTDVPRYAATAAPQVATAEQGNGRETLTEVRIGDGRSGACECCLMFWFRSEGAARLMETVIITFNAADAEGAATRAERLWNLVRGTRGRPLAINLAALSERRGRYDDLMTLESDDAQQFLGDIVILHEDNGVYRGRIAVSRDEVQQSPRLRD